MELLSSPNIIILPKSINFQERYFSMLAYIYKIIYWNWNCWIQKYVYTEIPPTTSFQWRQCSVYLHIKIYFQMLCAQVCMNIYVCMYALSCKGIILSGKLLWLRVCGIRTYIYLYLYICIMQATAMRIMWS